MEEQSGRFQTFLIDFVAFNIRLCKYSVGVDFSIISISFVFETFVILKSRQIFNNFKLWSYFHLIKLLKKFAVIGYWKTAVFTINLHLNKIFFHKQYLFCLLTSTNAKKNRTYPFSTYAKKTQTIRFCTSGKNSQTYFVWKETNHKPLKVAAANTRSSHCGCFL